MRSLIEEVAPLIWKEAQQAEYKLIVIKRFYLSTSNRVYKCTLGAKPVMVRVYGDGASLLVDREHEVEVTRLMCTYKLAAQIYCSFENGYIVDYIEGNAIEVEQMSDPKMSKLIAAKIAEWHCSLPPIPPPFTSSPLHAAHTPVPTHTRPKVEGKRGMWVTINRWLAVAEDTVPAEELAVGIKEIVENEARLIAKYADRPLVMCHNDINYGNVLYNPDPNVAENDHVSFVDYEYAAFNFRGFDIGNHFNEYGGLVLDFSKYPTREVRKEFARHYVRRCQELKHFDGDLEAEVERVVTEAEDFSQISHLFWHVWALVIAHTPDKPGDFNYVKYAELRLKEYFAKKPLLEQRDQGLLGVN